MPGVRNKEQISGTTHLNEVKEKWRTGVARHLERQVACSTKLAATASLLMGRCGSKGETTKLTGRVCGDFLSDEIAGSN